MQYFTHEKTECLQKHSILQQIVNMLVLRKRLSRECKITILLCMLQSQVNVTCRPIQSHHSCLRFTFPMGLFGVLMMIAFVFELNLLASSSWSSIQSALVMFAVLPDFCAWKEQSQRLSIQRLLLVVESVWKGCGGSLMSETYQSEGYQYWLSSSHSYHGYIAVKKRLNDDDL